MPDRRIFVLGLDGLDLRRAARLARLSRWPLLDQAHGQGRLIPLDTPFPSADAAWASLLTGVNPGWHGLYGDGETPPEKSAVPSLIALLRKEGRRIKAFSTLDGPIPDPPATGDPDADAATIRRLTATALGRLGKALGEWRGSHRGSVVLRMPEVAQVLAIEADHADFNHPAGDLLAAATLSDAVQALVGDCLGVLSGVAQEATDDELVLAVSAFGVAPAHRELSVTAWLAGHGWSERARARGGFVRLKLRGRNPDGSVEEGKEAADAARELAGALAEIRHPVTGDPVVRRVSAASDLYTGDLFSRAPELVVEPFPGYRLAVGEGGEPVRPVHATGLVDGRDVRFGPGVGLLFCNRALERAAATPLDAASTLFDWLGAARHRFAEGEGIL